jgi:hypothetical protein
VIGTVAQVEVNDWKGDQQHHRNGKPSDYNDASKAPFKMGNTWLRLALQDAIR